MSARINGTTNTNNNINIENNIKLVSLGRGDSNLINLLEAKANLASPTFTGTVTLPNTTNIGNVTSTELSYLSGVTSGIQTKLLDLSNNKANSSNPIFTGTLIISNISANNISVSGDIANVIQIIPQIVSDISTSLGTSTNIWQRAFIHDLSGITSINGTSWSLISDFSGTDISTSLIPTTTNFIDLGTPSIYWRNAYIHDLSITNISISGSINIPNSSILTKDISNLNITTDKIANDAITNDKIAHDAIGNNNIQDDAVTYAKIAHDTIQASNIDTSASGTWTFRNISGTYMTISGNLEPLNNITSDLGSSSKYWHNAYIDNIDVSSHIRIGQGHFGGKILSTSTEHEIIIDPHGYDYLYTGNDASGAVIILGDLIVRGNTTTINSASIDISDLILNIASNATRDIISDTESGIELGSDKYATLLYNSGSNSWKTNIGLEVSGNIKPTSNGRHSLGTDNMTWVNAYIQNISASNISVSGSINVPDNSIDGSKIISGTISSNKINSTNTWTFTNISGTHMSISGNLEPLYPNNTNTLGSTTNYWHNAYIQNISASNISVSGSINVPDNSIDGSKIISGTISSNKINSTNTWTFTNISGTHMSISGNLEPLYPNNTNTLGSTTNYWHNAYIQNISASNISVSGSIDVPDNSIDGSKIITGTISSDKIDSTNTWTFTNISGTHMTISGNLEPLYPNNTSTLGSTTNYWSNAYIQNISANNMSVSGNITIDVSSHIKFGHGTSFSSSNRIICYVS